jgi:high-affinity nickel-transport protein
MKRADRSTRGRGRMFSRREKVRLGAMFGVIVLLHVLGWSLFAFYGNRFGAAYAGAGSIAYLFGLRHAFDADHISAIDDTTRYLMQSGKRPMGVGFFFSLGHSSVVFGLALAIAVTARGVQHHLSSFVSLGATIGATISGTFLLVIALLDFMILRGILRVWKRTKSGDYDREELEDLMSQRGFMNRILGSRWRRFITESWHMYPVGFLFGLGLDTASEVGLLALTAAAATAGPRSSPASTLPILAVMALPLLFAAGMSLMDTTDGVFMAKAYDWAFRNPLRKVYYNIATVGLGVFVAGVVGTAEYLQVISARVNWHGPFWDWLNNLDFEIVGYLIVAAFIVVWIGSVVLYKARRIEERYAPPVPQALPPR